MYKFQRLGLLVIILLITSFLVGSLSAQDEQESKSAVDVVYSIYTATDIVSDNPKALQALLDAGFTKEDIHRLKQHIQAQDWLNSANVPLALANVIDNFPVVCNAGATANIIIQVGNGPHTLTHTFANGTTNFVGFSTCSDVLCIVSGGASKVGVATSFFTSVSTSYNHRIHSWCS